MSLDLIHGGALDVMRAAFPDAAGPWIDLSTGINPWPYPDTSQSASSMTQLPRQASYEACKQAMAQVFAAPLDSLVLSPGSELLIRLLPDLIGPRRIAILSPTYGDHFAVWTHAGTDILQTEDPLRHAADVDAVIVTQPNNPDGRVFDLDALETARQTLAARGGWLIVDEAFADLVPAQSMAGRGGADGLIILRSFGKFFGLPGVRLGAMLAPRRLREALVARLGFWPVSGAALEIGARAYTDFAWQSEARMKLSVAAQRLNVILKQGGLSPVGGTNLYCFVEVADAHAAFHRFGQAGIYVRRFDWTNAHLRIGLPATPEAETRLKAALIP